MIAHLSSAYFATKYHIVKPIFINQNLGFIE